MSITQLEGPVISVHSGGKAEVDKLMVQPMRTRLYEEISAHGGHPVMTRGKNSLEEETGEFQSYYLLEKGEDQAYLLQQQTGRIAVHAARDFSRRLVTEAFPYLNHPDVREICTDKEEIYKLLPGLQPESYIVDLAEAGVDALEETLDQAESSYLVAKPVRGSQGRNVFRGDKRYIQDQIAEQRAVANKPVDRWIIQHALDTTRIPDSIQPASELQASKFNRLKEAHNPKELRLIMIDERAILGIVRLADPNRSSGLMGEGDHWIFIDQDTLPAQALEQAQQIAAAIRKKTNVKDTIMAIDQAYFQGGWYLLDVNHESRVQARHDEKQDAQEQEEREYWLRQIYIPKAQKLIVMGERKEASDPSDGIVGEARKKGLTNDQ